MVALNTRVKVASLSTPPAANRHPGRRQHPRWWSSTSWTTSSFDTVPTRGTTLHAPHPWPRLTATHAVPNNTTSAQCRGADCYVNDSLPVKFNALRR